MNKGANYELDLTHKIYEIHSLFLRKHPFANSYLKQDGFALMIHLGRVLGGVGRWVGR